MRWRRYTLLTFVVVALAFQFRDFAYAQGHPPWFLRLEGGKAKIHDSPDDGEWGAVRLGLQLESRGYARLDLGLSYSSSDDGFAALEFGIEGRPLPAAMVTPVLGVGLGVLAEPEWTGDVLRLWGAVDAKIGSKVRLRLGLQLGRHGGFGFEGPDVIFGGLEFALGKSAA